MNFSHILSIGSSGILKIFDPEWIEQFLESISPWQYILLFAVIYSESGILIGMFLPGDSLLVTAGIMAAAGKLNIYVLVPMFFIAAFAGDQTGYYIGRKTGTKIFQKEEARFLKISHIEKTSAFFEKHGPKTIVLARFVPIVRTIAPIMAGTAKMHYKTFVIFNAVGALIWGVGVTFVGYFLGQIIGPDIDKYLLPIIFLIVFLSFIPPFIEWCRNRKKIDEELGIETSLDINEKL